MTRFTTRYDNQAKQAIEEARKAGHTRLLCYNSSDYPNGPVDWRSFPDDAAMMKFIESWDRAESIALNCAVAVIALNPLDSDETIQRFIETNPPIRRKGRECGYFDSSF